MVAGRQFKAATQSSRSKLPEVLVNGEPIGQLHCHDPQGRQSRESHIMQSIQIISYSPAETPLRHLDGAFYLC
jgi:hypothetical protein